jgi:IS5 family transposase
MQQTAYLVRDRLSWMRFCGLGLGEGVPDANTLWDFREALIKARTLDELFRRLDLAISHAGYSPMGGQIIDATLVAAPRQRDTDGENNAIKAGHIPQAWQDKPAKLRKKGRHLRWTVKFSKAKPKEDGSPQIDIAIPTFGYKNHISIDRRHGIIRRSIVTAAAVADGARLRQGQPHPPKEASGQADAQGDGQSQCVEIHSSRPCQTRLCRAKEPHAPVHTHHRQGQGRSGDDPGKHGLQHEALVLAGSSGG